MLPCVCNSKSFDPGPKDLVDLFEIIHVLLFA